MTTVRQRKEKGGKKEAERKNTGHGEECLFGHTMSEKHKFLFWI